MFNFCQILNRSFKNCQKTFKMLQKWQNFAKSGHTVVEAQVQYLMKLRTFI